MFRDVIDAILERNYFETKNVRLEKKKEIKRRGIMLRKQHFRDRYRSTLPKIELGDELYTGTFFWNDLSLFLSSMIAWSNDEVAFELLVKFGDIEWSKV